MLKIPGNLAHNRMLIIGGVVAVGAGLLVLYQRKKTTGAATAAGTTTASSDISGLSASLQGLLGGLSDQNSQIGDNLSKLIATSDQDFVTALNNQTGTLSSQLQNIGANNGAADIEKAIAAQTTTLTNAINNALSGQSSGFSDGVKTITSQASLIQQDVKAAIVAGTNATNAFAAATENDLKSYYGQQNQQSLVAIASTIAQGTSTTNAESGRLEKIVEAFIANAFAGIAPDIATLKMAAQNEAQQITQGTQALAALSANVDKYQDNMYLNMGLQSAAACYVGNQNKFDDACLNAHTLIDWSGGGTTATRSAEITSKYSSCLRGDHYDLVCVGKLIKSRFGQ